VIIGGKECKQVTNGSKKAVMDVIGFLCASLGSRTVHFHDSLGSRRACACSEAGFSSQNGDGACGLYYRRAEFCCVLLLAKGLNAKDIHKEIFLFTVGSVRLVKQFTIGSRNVANVWLLTRLKRR
jgi:hypothetical protein